MLKRSGSTDAPLPLHEVAKEGLLPIAVLLAPLIAYTAFTERNMIGTPDAPVFWADVAVAVYLAGLAIFLWRQPVPSAWVHPIAFSISMVLVATSLVTLWALGVGPQPFNLSIVTIGSAAVYVSIRWYMAYLVVTATAFYALIGGVPFLEGSNADFVFTVSAVVGTAIQFARVRSVRRLVAAEASEAKRRAEAESLAEELERFASVVAHDLQNPVQAVRLKAALLARLSSEQATLRVVRDLDRVADQMGIMISDLLSYAKAGRAPDSNGDVDLSKVIDDVRLLFEERLAEVDGTLSAADLPSVRGDATQLRELFSNLIGNALHYRRWDVPIRIDVHGTRLDDGIVVTVADNGSGFPPELAERIFMPFARGDHEEPGHGIGLATCRRIVERHGGTIKAGSLPGSGALFTIWLPSHA